MEFLAKILTIAVIAFLSSCGDFDNACDLDKQPDKDCDSDGILNRNDPNPETKDTTDGSVATEVDTKSYARLVDAVEIASALKDGETGDNELVLVGFNQGTSKIFVLKNVVTSGSDKYYPLLTFNASNPQVEITNLDVTNSIGIPVAVYFNDNVIWTLTDVGNLQFFELDGTQGTSSNVNGVFNFPSTIFEKNDLTYMVQIQDDILGSFEGQIAEITPSTGQLDNEIEFSVGLETYSSVTYFEDEIYTLSTDRSLLKRFDLDLEEQQSFIVSTQIIPEDESDSTYVVGTDESLFFVSLLGDILKVRRVELID